MKKTILYIAALFLFTFNGFAEEKIVTIATIEYPPYTSQYLKNDGFMTELAMAAFQLSGYRVELVYLPWARALAMTKQGRFDGLMDMWYRLEREEFFIFSQEITASRIVFFKRKDNPATFNTYEDLKKYKIGVVRGYVNPPKFDAMRDQLMVDEATSDMSNLKKLLGKRIDLILMDQNVGLHLINTLFSDKADQLTSLPQVLKHDPLHIGFSRKAPNIDAKIKAFNDGIITLKASGQYQTIIEKHGL